MQATTQINTNQTQVGVLIERTSVDLLSKRWQKI